ncbi:hypothetical protein ACJX0J_035893 [Zea mays]
MSPKIQRAITECFAREILGYMMEEIGTDVFSLLWFLDILINVGWLKKNLQHQLVSSIILQATCLLNLKKNWKWRYYNKNWTKSRNFCQSMHTRTYFQSQEGWESLLSKMTIIIIELIVSLLFNEENSELLMNNWALFPIK